VSPGRRSSKGAPGGRLVWIFDLDNTLHDASPHIFPHMNRSMTAYVVEHLAVDEAQADELRTRYWRKYGATLLGLMRHHGVDPHHFLWHTHQFPELPAMVLAHPALKATLRRLPGRKILFSNSPQHYSRAVLRVLRIGRFFDDVFTIEHTGFRPKPDIAGFRRLLRRHRLHPRRCVMVEDAIENLATAKRLGMRTVLVGRTGNKPAFVDVALKNVTGLPRALLRR
jgi:putative hydrolase of the HAD superfamily